MKTYEEMQFHPDSEKLAQILCDKTRNEDPLFFRIMIAYYFSMCASMMRAQIQTLDGDALPVNMFAINLATSGAGKGHSTNIIEDKVLDQFRHNFTEHTFQLLADANLPKLAHQRAMRFGTDPADEHKKCIKEFDQLGPLLFAFDSGTTPAIKQARQKLLMADAGSLNFQMDEIASNLLANSEAFSAFLELYDVGKIKQKIVKNTTDNSRNEEIHGGTPANMMLFGTPARLLNGGKAEEEFYGMLEDGYARRSFFGYSRTHRRKAGLTVDEIFKMRTDTSTNQFIDSLSDRLGNLADMSHVGLRIQIDEDISKLFIEYQLKCEDAAAALPEHESTRAAEVSHRHFKALKLAGTYAFIDGSPEITEDHAYYAIKLAEASGKAFEQILSRDRPHVRLAKFICDVNRDVTQHDLVEELPFYKGSTQQKAEMLQLAIAYGYKNNMIIKKSYDEGIEFFTGEKLEETDLNNMILSYSDDVADDYMAETAAFEDLHVLTQAQGKHWCNHAFKGNHRSEDNAIPGFNMIVLDIDKGVNLSQAQELLADYKAHFYTTKSHTEEEHCFRIILPINYKLEMDAKEFKEFMANIFQWIPFEADPVTGQRSRKWLSHAGEYHYQDGQLLDILPFIPKTARNETFQQTVLNQAGLDNLERWMINNSGDGNRNNMLLRFAMILKDGGFNFDEIRQRVNSLNEKMSSPLPEAEILGTVMVSVGKALSKIQ